MIRAIFLRKTRIFCNSIKQSNLLSFSEWLLNSIKVYMLDIFFIFLIALVIAFNFPKPVYAQGCISQDDAIQELPFVQQAYNLTLDLAESFRNSAVGNAIEALGDKLVYGDNEESYVKPDDNNSLKGTYPKEIILRIPDHRNVVLNAPRMVRASETSRWLFDPEECKKNGLPANYCSC